MLAGKLEIALKVYRGHAMEDIAQCYKPLDLDLLSAMITGQESSALPGPQLDADKTSHQLISSHQTELSHDVSLHPAVRHCARPGLIL